MYRNGFQLDGDNSEFRPFTDQANQEFLRKLASGLVPDELKDPNNPDDTVEIGMVDKRNQDFEEQFRTFSGEGQALGASTTQESNDGIIDPNTFSGYEAPSTLNGDGDTAMVRVTLLNGKRVVLKLKKTSKVGELVALLHSQESFSESYSLMGGYPPKKLTDLSQDISQAGLVGASITQKKV